MARVGRPPMFDDPEQMQEKIDLYFADCDAKGGPYTVPGLCYFLGFESRQSFFDYEQRERFSYTIKRARFKIESQRLTKMLTNSQNVTAAIFDLKCNFGYQDTQKIDVNANHSVDVKTIIDTLGGEDAARNILSKL